MSAKILKFNKKNRVTVDGEYYTLASGSYTDDNIIGEDIFSERFRRNSARLAEHALFDAMSYIEEYKLEFVESFVDTLDKSEEEK